MQSFYSQIKAVEKSACDYINKTISEKGEITIDPRNINCGEILSVAVSDKFTGAVFNLYPTKIKKDSLVGASEIYGMGELEVYTHEWEGDTAAIVADFVATHYGDLK